MKKSNEEKKNMKKSNEKKEYKKYEKEQVKKNLKNDKKEVKKERKMKEEREGEYIPSYPTDGYPISYILSLSGCSRRTQVTRKHLTSEKSNLFSRILTLFPKEQKKRISF